MEEGRNINSFYCSWFLLFLLLDIRPKIEITTKKYQLKLKK